MPIITLRTILYEIFLEEYPYYNEHLEIVIWNIASGKRLHTFDGISIAIIQVSQWVSFYWEFDQQIVFIWSSKIGWLGMEAEIKDDDDDDCIAAVHPSLPIFAIQTSPEETTFRVF